MTRYLLLVAVAATALGGCGPAHTAAWESKTPTGPVTPAAAGTDDVKVGDEHWAKRDDRRELEAAIDAWGRAVANHPDDAATYAKLARAAYLLADGHLSFEVEAGGDAAKEKYLQMHERGMTYGEHALMAASAEFKKRVEAGTNVEEAADILDKSAVPALYWYTSNLGKWANAQGFATVLKFKNKIKRMIERCQALDPEFFYRAPDRYLGVIYAKAPAIAGGDMGKAKEHFDRALSAHPNYLATHVLWAEFYAVKAEDKAGFKRELEFVIKAADDALPDVAPENKIEKKKAQKLLSQIEDKF